MLSRWSWGKDSENTNPVTCSHCHCAERGWEGQGMREGGREGKHAGREADLRKLTWDT